MTTASTTSRETTAFTHHPSEVTLASSAGKWLERKGEGTAIYYHPAHTYNIDELLLALNGARKYYSLWFREYPWKELKLSEFPSLSTYAQSPVSRTSCIPPESRCSFPSST